MSLEKIKIKLEAVLSAKRYIHSINVMETSIKLAEVYGAQADKAAIAGLLHDCARDIRGENIFETCRKLNIKTDYVSQAQPELLHGPIGAKLAESEYGIRDTDILQSIYYHTTGCENMTLLTKIIFVADYIEPDRSFHGLDEIRRLAYIDLEGSLIKALDKTISFVLAKGSLIHTDTIKARNYLIYNRKKA